MSHHDGQGLDGAIDDHGVAGRPVAPWAVAGPTASPAYARTPEHHGLTGRKIRVLPAAAQATDRLSVAQTETADRGDDVRVRGCVAATRPRGVEGIDVEIAAHPALGLLEIENGVPAVACPPTESRVEFPRKGQPSRQGEHGADPAIGHRVELRCQVERQQLAQPDQCRPRPFCPSDFGSFREEHREGGTEVGGRRLGGEPIYPLSIGSAVGESEGSGHPSGCGCRKPASASEVAAEVAGVNVGGARHRTDAASETDERAEAGGIGEVRSCHTSSNNELYNSIPQTHIDLNNN